MSKGIYSGHGLDDYFFRKEEAMMIGVSHYCENDECKVEIFTCSVDEVADKATQCPGCGQFGRTKGRSPTHTSRSIGTEPIEGGAVKPEDSDPHR